jgi:hypothetical protein
VFKDMPQHLQKQQALARAEMSLSPQAGVEETRSKGA